MRGPLTKLIRHPFFCTLSKISRDCDSQSITRLQISCNSWKYSVKSSQVKFIVQQRVCIYTVKVGFQYPTAVYLSRLTEITATEKIYRISKLSGLIPTSDLRLAWPRLWRAYCDFQRRLESRDRDYCLENYIDVIVIICSNTLEYDKTVLTYCGDTATWVKKPGETLKPRSSISGGSFGSCNNT